MKKLKRLTAVMLSAAMIVSQCNIMAFAADSSTLVRSVSDNAITMNQDEPEIINEVDTVVYDAGDDNGDINEDNQESENLEIAIDEEHFQDEAFRDIIETLYDKDQDGVLSDDEIQSIKNFEYEGDSIKSLKGIENFTGLQTFKLKGSAEIKELNLSDFKSLKYIRVEGAYLNKVTVSNNEILDDIDIINAGKNVVIDILANPKLEEISISKTNCTLVEILDNKLLNDIDFYNCEIKKALIKGNAFLKDVKFRSCSLLSDFLSGLGRNVELEIYNCHVTELDFSDVPELKDLMIDNNYDLSVVDISNCNYISLLEVNSNEYLSDIKLSEKTDIDGVYFSNNGYIDEFDIYALKNCYDISLSNVSLKTVDFSGFDKLMYLYLDSCGIREINFPDDNMLYELIITHNKINELDLSGCSSLQYLDCSYNQLTKLDITKSGILKELNCSYNKLTELDLSNHYCLEEIMLTGNDISEIDISKTRVRTYHTDTKLGNQNNSKKMLVKIAYWQLNESEKDSLEELWNVSFSVVDDPICFAIDEDNFSDEAFRNQLKNYDSNMDNNISESELIRISSIGVTSDTNSIKGIDLLKYLSELNISAELDEIDLSSNIYLTSLKIAGGTYEHLDLSKNIYLEHLNIYNNKQLTDIDLSNNKSLLDIIINSTGLKTIRLCKDVKVVNTIDLMNNELDSLDVDHLEMAYGFNCSFNLLTELNLINYKNIYVEQPFMSFILGPQNDDKVVNAIVSKDFYENSQGEKWFEEQKEKNVNFIVHEHEIDDTSWHYDGDTHYQKCKSCDGKFNVEKHEVKCITKSDVMPKCNERFVKDYYVCKCGLYEDSECTKKIDDFAAWSKDEKNLLPAGPHSWDEGAITKNATYFEKGVKVYTCSVCKETKTEDIEKLDYIEVPAKGKYDVKQAVNYLMTVSGNSTNGYTYTKFKYTVSDKKVASVSSKGILKAKKDGKIKVTVFGRNASKKYDELGSFDILVKTPNITKKVTVTSLNEAIDLNKLVDNIPAGYAVSFDISKSSAKKAELDKATNMIKPVKKGTITVKCIIGEGKNALKKSIKIVVKPAK